MISVTHSISISEHVVARKVGEDMVLLNLESGQYFGLDTIGARVWEILESKPQTLSEIGAVIHDEYDAPRGEIENDLVLLANALLDKKLIVAD
ncbi:MAG: PqqD family protein [Pseudomonadota bacterium]